MQLKIGYLFQCPPRATPWVNIIAFKNALHALKGQKLLAQGNALGNYEHKPVAL